MSDQHKYLRHVKKTFIALSLLFGLTMSAYAQGWDQSYTLGGRQIMVKTIQTSDGGFVALTEKRTNTYYDASVFKTNGAGRIAMVDELNQCASIRFD